MANGLQAHNLWSVNLNDVTLSRLIPPGSFNETKVGSCGVMNFSSETKNRLLRDVQFKRGIGVNRSSAKSVLKSIYRYGLVTGECFAQLSTLAKDAQVSVSTVRRTLDSLYELNLLGIQRKPINDGGFKHRYRIQILWESLNNYVNQWKQNEVEQKRSAALSGQWTEYKTKEPSQAAPTTEEPPQVPSANVSNRGSNDSKPAPVNDVCDSRGSNDCPDPKTTETVKIPVKSGGIKRATKDAVKSAVGKFCDSTKCVDDARHAGVSDRTIEALVAIFEVNRLIRPNWKPGALYHRILLERTNKDRETPLTVLEGWPDPASTPDAILRMRRREESQRRLEEKRLRRWQIIRQGRNVGATNADINRVLRNAGCEPIPEYTESETSHAPTTKDAVLQHA